MNDLIHYTQQVTANAAMVFIVVGALVTLTFFGRGPRPPL
jgi:hypothetical protein